MTRKLLAALLLLGTAGCNFWYNDVPSPDDLMHAVPWFDHMIYSQAVHPYEAADMPRNTPKGIVPIGGAEADWGTGNPLASPMPKYGFDSVYANRMTRPTDLPAVAPGRGQELFQTFCEPCHGANGTGAGLVPIGAPPLNIPRTATLSDGYIYSYIRYGGFAIMPQYGDKITKREDRWAVVDYVRSFQAGSQP